MALRSTFVSYFSTYSTNTEAPSCHRNLQNNKRNKMGALLKPVINYLGKHRPKLGAANCAPGIILPIPYLMGDKCR